MQLSTHYYVLSLGDTNSTLSEAFRDCLIEVENQGFPVKAPGPGAPAEGEQLQSLAREIDACFARYYANEPLRLVVVGDQRMQTVFSSVTAHGSAVIGRVDGDHTGTPARDLGQIVWPVVKEAISGLLEEAMQELETSSDRDQIATGLEAVARRASDSVRGKLLVEDDYHLRGGITDLGRSAVVSPNVDVRDAMDDAVDVVIEMVLESGGNVVFTPNGSLVSRDRIVLLHRDKGGR